MVSLLQTIRNLVCNGGYKLICELLLAGCLIVMSALVLFWETMRETEAGLTLVTGEVCDCQFLGAASAALLFWLVRLF
jgi:hypothetical protein